MEQIKEFNHYYIQKTKGEENPMTIKEQNEKEFNEKPENNIINKEEPQKIVQKSKLRKTSSKRLHSSPKQYQTYKMDYKKKIIEEVSLIFLY